MSRKADPSRSDADWSFSRTSLSSQHRAQPPTENFFVRAFLWFFTEPASATELTDKNVGYLDRDIAFEPGQSSSLTCVADLGSTRYIPPPTSTSSQKITNAGPPPKQEQARPGLYYGTLTMLLYLLIIAQTTYTAFPYILRMLTFKPVLHANVFSGSQIDNRVLGPWSDEQEHYYEAALTHVTPATIPKGAYGPMADTNTTLNRYLGLTKAEVSRAITFEKLSASHIVVTLAPMITSGMQSDPTEFDFALLQQTITEARKQFNATADLLSNSLRYLSHVESTSLERLELEQREYKQLETTNADLNSKHPFLRGPLTLAANFVWWSGYNSPKRAAYYQQYVELVGKLQERLSMRKITLTSFERALSSLGESVAEVAEGWNWMDTVDILCTAVKEDLYDLSVAHICVGH